MVIETIVRNVPFFSSMSKESPSPTNARAFDITLLYDDKLQLLRQKFDQDLDAEIHLAYQSGSQLGIEMNDATIGNNYAENFFNFITSRATIDGTRSLEIGCGNGYFLSLLQKSGSNAIGIEPGSNGNGTLTETGTKIIHGFFPQDLPVDYQLSDLIVAHAVLEHMVDPVDVLIDIKRSLKPGGQVFIAVPDCGPYLRIGDPSILLHEHFSYFTDQSLRRIMQLAGFSKIEVVNASYGNLLYAIGVNTVEIVSLKEMKVNSPAEHTFIQRVNRVRNGIIELASKKQNQLGIYCPARAISVLPPWGDYRLFDDDLSIYSHYFPIWNSKVENRADLCSNPVDELWIMSLSFGDKIKAELEIVIPNTLVYTLREIIELVAENSSGN
jgi:SAM-dependent methyltransferase